MSLPSKINLWIVVDDDDEPDEEEAFAEAQNKENEAPAESTTTAQIQEKREPKEKLPKRIYTDSEADRYELLKSLFCF